MLVNAASDENKVQRGEIRHQIQRMQSHTFTRARGVPIYLNGSAAHSHTHIYDDQPSTSREPSVKVPRSASYSRPPLLKAEQTAPLPPTFVPRFHKADAARKMKYQRLGNTDIIISKVALGCGAIGGLFGEIEDSITQIVETALKEGINFIDTSYWYGQTRSESILGKILAKVPRRAYYIATKVGRFELDYARAFDFRADKILESLTESLKRLRLTHIDVCFVQIHDADFQPNHNIVIYETLQALEMAKASGKIRYIGLTGYPLKKLRALIAHSPTQIDVLMSYCHGSLNDNSLAQHVQFFQSRGVGILNASCLSMGLLTGKGPPPWHPANQAIKETIKVAVEYVESKNLRIERIALDYGFNFPGCVAGVIGCASLGELRESIAIAIGEAPLTEVEKRVRDRIMRRHLDPLNNAGWEGVDVAKYWSKLKKSGLTALATHRHSSVESLASTLNGFSFGSSDSRRRTPSISRSATPSSSPMKQGILKK